ncbi:hypothetical protein L9F63_021437, partial [Diploptera punctata]
NWKRYVKFKIAYHSCVSLLYQGQQAEEQQKMGERVAYYQAASEKLEEATKLSKGMDNIEAVNEALTFTMDVVEGKKKAAKNENEFIYHEEVPDKDSLVDVKGASLVKGIAFSVNDPDVSGADIFARLVPMKAHESASLYSEEKAKLLRRIGGMVEEKDHDLETFMASLQLEHLNIRSQQDRIPQDLVDRCAALSAKPNAIQNLVDSMNKLADIYHDVECMLQEIKQLLEQEDVKEKEYQQMMGKRPPSIVATDLTREANKYQEAHAKASESNQTLHKAMTLHISNLKILSQPLEEIQKHIPNIALETPADEESEREMQYLTNKVDDMRKKRAMLVAQLRESVCQDDITHQLVTHTGESLDAVFSQEMEKHQTYVNLIEQNLIAQDNILKALTEAYARYAGTRKAVSELVHKREATVSALISSYDAYEDLLAKSSKGLEFYRKLETNVTKLLQRVKGTCKVQEEEREQILVKNKKTETESAAPKLKDYLQGMKQGATGGYISGYASQVPNAYYNANASRYAPVASSQPPVSTDYGSQVPAEATIQQQFVPAVRPAPVGSEGTNEQRVAVKFDTGETAAGIGMKMEEHPATTYSTSTQYNFTDTYPYRPDMTGYKRAEPHVYVPAKSGQYYSPQSANNVEQKSQDNTSYYGAYAQYHVSGPSSQAQVPSSENYQFYAQSGTDPNLANWYQHQQYYQQLQQYQQSQNVSSVSGVSTNSTTSVTATPSSQYQTSTVQTPGVNSYQTTLHSYPSGVNTYQTTQPSIVGSYQAALPTNVQSYPTSLPSGINTYQSTQSSVVSSYPTTVQSGASSLYHSGTNTSSQQVATTSNLSMASNYPQYQISSTQSPGVSSAGNVSSYQSPSQTSTPSSNLNQFHTTTQAPNMSTASNTLNQYPQSSSSYQPIPAQVTQYQYPYPYQYTPQVSADIAGKSTAFQYMASPGNSCYTNAGTYNTSQTCSAQTAYPVQYDSPSYQSQTPYYSLPYGYQYGTDAVTPGIIVQNPQVYDQQNANQNQSTYMQASGQNDSTTTTYSQKGGSSRSLSSSQSGISCNGNDAKSASNVDLLAGLDFSLNQAPLEPQQQSSSSAVKKEEDTSVSSPVKQVVTTVAKTVEPAACELPETSEQPAPDVKQPSPDLNQEESKASKTFGKDPYTDPEALNQFVQEVGKYEKFVDGLTTKTLNGPTPLDMKWKELLELQEKDAHKRSISVARCYPMKNRFSDILPYDHSRIELPSTKDDYINASYIKNLTSATPPFIATQAPLPSTYSDFWTMVWEQQVEVIVCLLNDTELQGQIYWPTQKGEELAMGKMKLSLQSSNVRSHWTERIISITVVETRASRVIVHLQFSAWPGSSFPPSPGPFLCFVSETLNLYSQQRAASHPIVVHCLSGVGRTGLFCLVAAAVCEIQAGRGLLDLVTTTATMSTCRKGSLRDREHLKFAYQAVLYYAQDLLMKRGILTSRSTFEDKRSRGGKSHTRHPSEDFLLGPATGLSQLQSGIEKMGIQQFSNKGSTPAQMAET